MELNAALLEICFSPSDNCIYLYSFRSYRNVTALWENGTQYHTLYLNNNLFCVINMWTGPVQLQKVENSGHQWLRKINTKAILWEGAWFSNILLL